VVSIRRCSVAGQIAIVAALAVAAGCTSTTGGPDATNGGTATAGARGSSAGLTGAKPNVLFVLTDDMRFDDLQYMPTVRQLIGDQGATFDNEFDNVTLCCPARTSILRGQYSHNTGVLTNGGPNGGFETAYADKVESSTVATAMHDAGYRTGLFGKYLNGYPDTAAPSYVPPGWDTWSSSSKGNAYGEYDYTLNQNGQQVAYGHKPSDYGTDVYLRQTEDFVNQASKAAQPFFAYLAVYAPHQPATPAPQDVGTFGGVQAPRDPSFDEADVSDKPAYIRQHPELTPPQEKQIDNLYRRRVRSLQAVDRGVAALVDQLRQNNQLDNTYIIFTSDNGFHLGQHRLPSGKQTAYETDIHLPLLVRGPGVTPGSHVRALTGNVDLAPTMADLGGASLTDDPDGRSLVPWLRPSSTATSAPNEWRQAFLLEHWTETSSTADRSGAGQLEPDDPDQGGTTPDNDQDPASATTTAKPRASAAGRTDIPEFQGLRVDGYTYVEYATGERELYDMVQDPDQVNNLASTANPALVDALHRRLDALRKCAGDSCRTAEAAPLNLPS
jgi:N-acetylglucosamine-6-sulfatase